MNYTNRKYNKLTLLHKARTGGKGVGAIWSAVCDCGNVLEVLARKVRSGDIKSCGNCQKGLGIQGSGQVVKQGIPKGHRDNFSKLLRQSEEANITAQDYTNLLQNRCILCNVRGVKVEWAENKPRISSTELIPICQGCSEWRRGRSISKFLAYVVKVASSVQNRISIG